MDFDTAVKHYIALRKECDNIERDAKLATGELKKKMNLLEAWITQKADEEGLKNVATLHGTAYWSTHHSCSVAEPAVFFDFVKDNGAWDLLEKRASKLAVKSFIEGSGHAPPGVNFSSVRVFNVKTTKE